MGIFFFAPPVVGLRGYQYAAPVMALLPAAVVTITPSGAAEGVDWAVPACVRERSSYATLGESGGDCHGELKGCQ